MKNTFVATLLTLVFALLLFLPVQAQQPSEGDNSYRLTNVNPRFLSEIDTLTCSSGRGIYVASNPDLDGDGKPEIIVTEYSAGGRVLVFEVVADDVMEFVWGSKILHSGFGGGSTPRSVSVGDFDNNGFMEIIFQVGYFASDSLEQAQRGIYIYEHTGNDNDYGAEPAHRITFEEIDPGFSALNTGRSENPMTVADIDGDGKSEMLFTPRTFGDKAVAGNLYILEVESGTFSNGDANIRLEYKYEDMAFAIDNGDDGYTPIGTAVGDIDSDGVDEVVVIGWTNANSGAGVGFFEVSGVDTYTPGTVVQLSETSIFNVKGNVKIVESGGTTAVVIGGGTGILVAENIASELFVSAGDFNVVLDGTIAFGILDIGDQDHGTGSDGFDIYFSTSPEIWNLEYNGSGSLADGANYTNHGRIGQFNLDEAYDVSDGLFNSIFTYPGMDLDNDGNRDIVVGHKGACGDDGDVLEGESFTKNSYGIFVFEWGDSTQSVPLSLTTDVKENGSGFTIITPEDYELAQNYPNPFNPTTNIAFTLPLDKNVSLKIYNSLGQEVRTLVDNQAYATGSHTIQWNAKDNSGNPVASGIYVYKLVFGNFSKTKTMTLVR